MPHPGKDPACDGDQRLSRPRGARWGGVQHIAGVVLRQAVEVELEGVEADAQVAAFFVVPEKGKAGLN